MTPQETFIARLRRHRERYGITLDDIARETRVKREQLESFERGDLSIWPNGLYARSWIRGYATAVGLDPTDTIDEFCRLFPQGDRRAASTFREFGAIISQPSDYKDEYDIAAHGDRRRPAEQVPEPTPTTSTWREQLSRAVRALRPARATRTVRTMHSN